MRASDYKQKPEPFGSVEPDGELVRRTFEKASVGVMIKYAADRSWEGNSAFGRMLGYDETEFRSMVYSDFAFPEDAAHSDAEPYKQLASGERQSLRLEKRYVRKDGSVIRVRLSAFIVEGGDGEPAIVVAVAEDIGERGTMEEVLHLSERRFRTVVEQSPLPILVFDLEGRSLAASSSWNELWNPGEGEDRGYSIFENEHLRATGLTRHIEESIATGSAVTTPPLLYDPGRRGRAQYIEASVYPLRDESGIVSEMTLVIEDITDRKALEDELTYRAFHDTLTGLPNRDLFLDNLKRALDRVRNTEDLVAIMFLDLDDFKVVNDSLGHEVGDRLLVAVSQRIKGCLRSGVVAARLGGDEFTVLLEGISRMDEAEEVAKRIIREIGSPFRIDGHLLYVSVSIGVALSGVAGWQSEDLLRAADVALYRAKREDKAQYKIFDHTKDAYALKRLELENDLRLAIEREELIVRYQPVFSLEVTRVTALEALLRWEHPERGMISPAEFIPVAEESGLIVPIGRWVLREACRQTCEWQKRHPGSSSLIMGVNLSLRQFQHPGLVGDVARTLRETGLDPQNLALEITESVAMHDVESTIATLEKLESLGVWLVIDDFGSGNSSVFYLTSRFRMNHLKLDGSFIREFVEDPENSAIIPGLIDLAHAVGLRVIAEGVETADQLQRLKEMGCEFVQGYYIAKPLTPAEVSEVLMKEEAGASASS